MTARSPITLAPDRDPWDQQPRESTRQHGRFLLYRDLGRLRTLKQTVQTLNAMGDPVAHRTLQQVAYEYRWTDRAQAWDVAQDEADRERLTAARRDMVERHRKVAGGLLTKALTALQSLDPRAVDGADIVRMIKLATDLERQALGGPDRVVAVTGPTGGPVQTEDVTNLTPGERRARLAEIAAELARRAGVTGDDDDADAAAEPDDG